MKTCYNRVIWHYSCFKYAYHDTDFLASFASCVEYRGRLMCDCRTSW